jgi:hypothetical protein
MIICGEMLMIDRIGDREARSRGGPEHGAVQVFVVDTM